MTAIERVLSKLLGGDVSEANDGHGLGCSCPKHKAEREERARKMLREGPEPGTIGAALAEELRRGQERRRIPFGPLILWTCPRCRRAFRGASADHLSRCQGPRR